jgi:protein SCO1/2
MTSRKSHLLLIFAAFFAGLATVAAVMLVMSGRMSPPAPAPAAVGGAFRLVDQNGQSVSDADLKGKPSLIFFGFTHCPDVCPTTLFEVSEILGKMGDDAGRVNALFVTVDPERDTQEKIKDYLSSFHPRLRGLTGDAAAIAAIEKAYRVYSKKVPLEGGGYTMDHTALVYLMDRDGRFVAPFNMRRTPEDAAAELRKYL